MGPWERREDLDTWVPGEHTSCSFCGSLKPDLLLSRAREGWVVGPTDKNYKAYLSSPVSDEEKKAHKARYLANFSNRELENSARSGNKTVEQLRAELEQHYDRESAYLVEGSSRTKVYFQHLSEDQRRDFIELYNDRTMKLAAPGHFYTMPFFMRLITEEESSG